MLFSQFTVLLKNAPNNTEIMGKLQMTSLDTVQLKHQLEHGFPRLGILQKSSHFSATASILLPSLFSCGNFAQTGR
ncbi:MAG TPA: hypothetical protein DF774_17025 [Rheinheimera sp.]|nr:hypothetical protein [Rheinheimera sp.]